MFNAYDNMQLYWNGVEVDGVYSGTGTGMSYSSANGAIGTYYPAESIIMEASTT